MSTLYDIRELEIPKAFRDLVQTRARYKAYYSGRGCAKSWSFARAAVTLAFQHPLRILCAREVQKTIKESVKYDLDQTIIRAGLQDAFVSTANTITSAAGAYFIFEGLQTVRAWKLQSLSEIDIVWVEEAHALSKHSLNTLIPTIRKEGSQLWFSWNPQTPKDAVDAMFRGSDIADQEVPEHLKQYYDKWAVVQKLTHADNPFFPEVIKVEMERDRVRDPDLYRHIWEGEYSHRSDAAVFKNWRVGTIDIPAGARPYYGADWGFSVDPTVLVRCFVMPESRVIYVDAEVGQVGIDIAKTPAFFDSITDDRNDPLHPRKWPIMADSARPETISHMQQNGYPKIERARKGPGSIEEGIEFLRSYDIVVDPRCKRVIDELTYYSYERDKNTDEVTPKLLDDHNHTIDALRYALEHVRRQVIMSYGGIGAVTTQREYPAAAGRQELQNPALSPARPGGGRDRQYKGLLW